MPANRAQCPCSTRSSGGSMVSRWFGLSRWLASVDQSARPIRLAASFPRIVNRMAKLWKTPREMDRYFEELLADTRGNRKGFALNILMELSTLKDHYQAKVYPSAQRDVWD